MTSLFVVRCNRPSQTSVVSPPQSRFGIEQSTYIAYNKETIRRKRNQANGGSRKVGLFYNSSGKPYLQSQLGTAPRATLHVVFDSVVRAEANPVRQRTILSLLLGQSALCTESLLGRLRRKMGGQ